MKIMKDGSGETYTYSDDEKYWFSNYTPIPPVTTKKVLTTSSPCGVIGDSIYDITHRMAYDVDQNVLDKIFQEMAKRFNQVPIIEHKCNNCGAVISMDADRHIFTCKYCGSAYAIGTAQINS